MRLSKKVWLVAGIAILAVVLGYLFMTYSQLVTEHRQLEGRLTVAQEDRLPGLTTEKGTLESQRVSATSTLASARARFPQAVESIEYGEHIFEIVRECNLTLTSLSFPRPSDRKEGAVTYSVVSLALPVSGKVADIFAFIQVIRTDERFASTEVRQISMSIEGGTASATISVDIYGYRG